MFLGASQSFHGAQLLCITSSQNDLLLKGNLLHLAKGNLFGVTHIWWRVFHERPEYSMSEKALNSFWRRTRIWAGLRCTRSPMLSQACFSSSSCGFSQFTTSARICSSPESFEAKPKVDRSKVVVANLILEAFRGYDEVHHGALRRDLGAENAVTRPPTLARPLDESGGLGAWTANTVGT